AFLKYYETNDANTAIREAEEQINKYVQDNK
ncbi:MAG: hypothetical protein K0Q59_4599, partial [Paenibacillus sp.]|nr:hypothetical protein [Paenibacillus sp.]